MPVGLNSTHKSNVTTFLNDLTAAIDSLSMADSAQAGVKVLLTNTRTQLLELIKNERTQ